jgi:hypothetical protein
MKDIINKSIQQNEWDLGNSVLYDLCRNHFTHKNDSEIIAKIWLIGRSYAAAIERRKNKDQNINDDFYITTVAPKIRKSGIDIWIEKCKESNQIVDYLETHKKLTNLFSEISGLEKRSLASKYLHFHLPNKFYIYDSRAVNAVNIFLKTIDVKKFNIPKIFNQYDEEYMKLYYKCDYIKSFVLENYSIDLNCRDLDNLLVEIANSKLRKL